MGQYKTISKFSENRAANHYALSILYHAQVDQITLLQP